MKNCSVLFKVGYLVKNTEYEDLLSVGNIGLIKATATYDASANNTFGTYAKKCIENEFYMAKRKTKKSVKGNLFGKYSNMQRRRRRQNIT
ncbi:sporulation sigma factor SigK [human gut metagenome]|uniref:Sporulation sigma factor SigK n=1 Tax=human gut metagenome TaxID=408170 RepID=K1T2Y7_9ZZZZ